MLALGSLIAVGGATSWAADQQATLAAGKAAYEHSCARCHGAEGRGDGVDAKRFYPRPRDLTLGVYKFRSTASGTPPTDDDLFKIVTHGLPGSNMPDWQHLDETVRWQLVAYLKSLSATFTQTPPSPVPVAPDPGSSGVDLAKGKAVYGQLGCAACHGSQGRANGPSAAGLVDDWGMPIRPSNLTQGWSYRGGSEPYDVMLRVLTGIDGAGMPSYTGAVSPEDAWQLAYYVASLQEPPHWNMIAHALMVDGPLPSAPDDPRWAHAERTDVRLRNAVTVDGEWATPPTVKAVTLRVISNGEGLAMFVTWDDPTQEPSQESPSDTPSPTAASTPGDAMVLALKPVGSQGDAVTLQVWPYHGAPTLDLCVWSAASGQAFERITDTFDDVWTVGGSPVLLKHTAHFADGRWQVVLWRSLRPLQPSGAAAIIPDELASVAVAVWDAGNPDARAVSPWIDLMVRSRLSPVAAQPSTGNAWRWWVGGIGLAGFFLVWLILRPRGVPAKSEESAVDSP